MWSCPLESPMSLSAPRRFSVRPPSRAWAPALAAPELGAGWAAAGRRPAPSGLVRPPTRSSRASVRRSFPNRDFDITKFGARPDGATDATEAIRRGHRRLSRRGRRPRRRAGRARSRPAPSISRAASICTSPSRRRCCFSRDPRAYLPVGVHAVGGRRADELLAAHLRLRRARTSPSPARGTLDGQAGPTTGGRGRAARTRSPASPISCRIAPS